MQINNDMLERMISKLSEQPDYMAWYLQQYAAEEKIPFQTLKDNLQLNEEQFARLIMCKAPNSRATDFVARLKSIQEYTGVNYFLLASIIRNCDGLAALKNSNTEAALLAARKQDDLQNEKGEHEL
jgi:hypothetical protein